MRISFLVHDVYGIGGTIRTTLNLASALADRHEVEIVSMPRHRAEPRFQADPQVALVPLVDSREGSADAADPFEPAAVSPAAERRHSPYSRLNGLRAERHRRRGDADVITGTRPGANVAFPGFKDGLLVPVGGSRALPPALLSLIGAGPVRRRVGEAARVSARRFDPGPIVGTHQRLFTELDVTSGRQRRQAWWLHVDRAVRRIS